MFSSCYKKSNLPPSKHSNIALGGRISHAIWIPFPEIIDWEELYSIYWSYYHFLIIHYRKSFMSIISKLLITLRAQPVPSKHLVSSNRQMKAQHSLNQKHTCTQRSNFTKQDIQGLTNTPLAISWLLEIHQSYFKPDAQQAWLHTFICKCFTYQSSSSLLITTWSHDSSSKIKVAQELSLDQSLVTVTQTSSGSFPALPNCSNQVSIISNHHSFMLQT